MFSLPLNNSHTFVVFADIEFIDLCALLEYIYTGESTINYGRIDKFLHAADKLQVKGIKDGKVDFFVSSLHNQQLQQQQQQQATNGTQITRTSPTSTVPQPFPTQPTRAVDVTLQPAAKKRSRLDDNQLEDSTSSHPDDSDLMKLLFANGEEPAIIGDGRQVQPVTSSSAPQFLNAPSRTFAPPFTKFISYPTIRNSTTPVQSPSYLSSTETGSPAQLPLNHNQLECQYCSKKYAMQRTLARHEKECLKNPAAPKVSCDVCSVEMRPSYLAQHKKAKHSNETAEKTSPASSSELNASDSSMTEAINGSEPTPKDLEAENKN